MTFTDDDLIYWKDEFKRARDNREVVGEYLLSSDKFKAILARLEAASRCAQLLADYADHDHVYWSSPKELTRCAGANSIDECDFTMNLKRQFKEAVEAWRKECGK